MHAPILAFPTETGQYILETDASNFGLGGVLSQIQDDVERVVNYCSRALRPSQRCYCTTKREMLAMVAMCIQFRSYLRGAKFTLHTDHKSLVWLRRFKDTEGNNFIFRAMTMEIPTDSPGPLRRHANSAPDRIAHRSSHFLSLLASRLTVSRPVGRRMLTWSPYSWVKIGWLSSKMICLNRLLLLVILFVFRLSSVRTLTTLHSTHGFRQGSFPHGMR